jgi:hypothetical protein
MYDFYEFCYNSQRFKDLSTHDLITLVYSFYTVHAGTQTFMNEIAESLLERLNEQITTYDLLRVMQTYSEISKSYPKLFLQLEQIFLRRFDQMSVDEITTCASGFAVSGYGSPYFTNLLE